MTESQEIDKEAVDKQLHEQQPALLGEVLQAARAARQLTLQDVSNSLRYSVKQIDALEKGDYDLLPDAVITRGFIRNYAKLLEIDAEPLLASYRETVSVQPEKMIAVKSSMRPIQLTKESQPWLKYIIGSILVLLFLLAWLFYIDYMPKPSRATADNTTEVVEKIAPVPAEALPEVALPVAQRAADDASASDLTAGTDAASNDLSPVAAADEKPADAAVAAEDKPLSAPLQQQAAMNVAADKGLTMTFTALSWVSVTDKTGRVVYQKIAHAGDKVTLNAAAPLTVVIGNAGGTRVNFKGTDVDLAPKTKDNVARITLE